MQSKKDIRIRFIRFASWAFAMLVASLIVNLYDPMRVKYVPMVFMALMGPAILIPFNSKKKTIA